MKEFTNAQKETLKILAIKTSQANQEWELFVNYLVREYGISNEKDKWELTLEGFKKTEIKEKET